METETIERTHGVASYVSGCRCDTCRVAWRGYQMKRARKAGRRSRAQYIAALKRGEPRRAAFSGKSRAFTVTVTPLGAQILQALQEREGKSFGDIVEGWAREHAPAVGEE